VAATLQALARSTVGFKLAAAAGQQCLQFAQRSFMFCHFWRDVLAIIGVVFMALPSN
jgi:hypothetical protein